MPSSHSRSRHGSKRRKETPQQIARTRKRHILLLVLFSVAVYLSALPGDFVWTDQSDIVQGEHRLTGWSDIGDALTLPRSRYRERFDGGAPDLNSGTWQPFTVLSNSVSWLVWGKCSACWHLENLLWHLLAVIGLYVLGRDVLSEQRHTNGMAFWSAALFAAHPSGVATVAWIGGRPELLAAALGIASLVLYSRLQATTAVRRGHYNRWMLGLGVLGLGAMLSHESAYLLPVAALLIGAIDARQRGRNAFSGIAPARWHAIWLLSGVLGLVLLYRYLFVGGLHFPGGYPTDSFFDNLGTALRHLWHFIESALLPSEPTISDAWEISNGWDAGEVASLLGTLLIIGAILIGLKFGHPTAFGVAWFLLWVAPGVGILPTDRYHSDHFLYLAVWGLMLSIVFAVTRAWSPIGRQLVRGSEAIIFAPILVVLMVISGFSNARWWGHERLFESELSSDPHYIEGRVQLARLALDNEKPADALDHLFTAIKSHESRKFTGYWDTANIYRLLGEAQLGLGLSAEAAQSLQKALKARPASARSWHLAGQAQLELGGFAEAEASLQRALELTPDDASVQADLGIALLAQGKTEQGQQLLSEALAVPGTGNLQRHLNLGGSLVQTGKAREALPHLRKALSFRETAHARATLAWAQWQLGERDAAMRNLALASQADDGDDEFVDWVNEQVNAAPPQAR